MSENDRQPILAGATGPAAKGQLYTEEKEAAATNPTTFEDVLQIIGIGWFHIRMFFVLSIALCCDAAEVVILSFLGVIFIDGRSGSEDWHVTVEMMAIMQGSVFCGMFIGSFLLGKMIDKFGRRPTELMFLVVIAVLAAASALSPWFWLFVACRFATGLCYGGHFQLTGHLIEWFPIKWRGFVAVAQQSTYGGGSMYACVIAWLLLPHYSWRVFVVVGALPSILAALLFWLYAPHSARQQKLAHKDIQAYATLKAAAVSNGRLVEAEPVIRAYCDTPIVYRNKRGQVRDLFGAGFTRTTLLSFVLWITFTASYFGVIIFDTNLLGSLQKVDAITAMDYRSLLIATTGELIVSLVLCVALIAFLPRQWALALNYVVFIASIGVIALLQTHKSPILTAAFALARGSSLAAANVTVVYTQEVYPTHVRGVATGVCNSISRFAAIFVPFGIEVGYEYWPYLPTVGLAATGVIGFLCAIGLEIDTSHAQLLVVLIPR